MVNCVRTNAAVMAIAAFTAPACWVTTEWCLCFSLEKQRDKSHSRYWSTARFSGLSRTLNHKDIFWGSFIPRLSLLTQRGRNLLLKSNLEYSPLCKGKRRPEQDVYKGKLSPTSQQPVELKLSKHGKPSGIASFFSRHWRFLQEIRVLPCSKGLWKRV